jgi:hypothetical protein
MDATEYSLQVHREITRESREVRQEYVRYFGKDAQEFSDQMGLALGRWLTLYQAAEGDERRLKVLALVYTAMSLHVNSMKLFMCGQQIAAGNLMRQVLEAIALTYLCTDKKLTVLERFDEGIYSTQKAIADAKRHAARLRLSVKAITKLEKAQKFYSSFSHPTKMTIGTLNDFSGAGIYLGSSYDEGKLKHYRTEISNRLGLAKQFNAFVQSIHHNLEANNA